MQPSSRPCWSQLVDDLLSVYHATSPGVYLDLELPCIPTPPSSPDTSDTEDNDVVNMYKTVTSVVSGGLLLTKSEISQIGISLKNYLFIIHLMLA